MTPEPAMHQALTRAVNGDRSIALGAACSTLPELVAQLRQNPGAAVLVDVGPQPERVLAMLDPVISRFSDARFIVIAEEPGQDLVLDAMEVGVRLVVPKGAIGQDPHDFARVLRRIAAGGQPGALATGSVIAVMSASGGCGASLLAVNLANELRLVAKKPGLLIDMDPWCGAVSGYLNLEAQYGLANVLADGTRIDGELIKSAAALYDESLHVLLSPAAAANRCGPAPNYGHLDLLLSAARGAFAHTVIDAPRLPMEALSRLAESSTATLVPFQLTVLGIRAARGLINALVENGCPSDQVIPVVSRYRRRRAMIGVDEAARALGRPTLGRLTNDFRSAVESINYGQPLAEVRPRSWLRRDIRRLAEQIDRSHSSGRPVPAAW